MDAMNFETERPARDRVVMPPIPKAMLVSIINLADRADEGRKIGEFVFNQTNHELKVRLSEIPMVESESFEAQAIYDTLSDERRKVDPKRKFLKPHPDRKPTGAQKFTHRVLFVCFLTALVLVASATANFAIDANLYPGLGNSIWMAVLTTGIAITVFIGGPICIYELKETDQDRRNFAWRMACLGLTLGLAWLFLFALVDALDNYNLVTLTAHRFHGDLAFLNTFLPVVEDVAKFLMVITQILGEASGAVAIELHAIRLKDAFRIPDVEANPYYDNLQERISAAQAVNTDFATQLAHLNEWNARLDEGRDVFATQCIAWLETFEKDNSIDTAVSRRNAITKQLKEWEHA
jgi:hypothetical protein